MDLLTIVQTACNEMGLPPPPAVIGATDTQTMQMLALANRDGNEVYREAEWTFLRKEAIINIGAPTTITADVTVGSTTLTNCSSTAGFDENFALSGTGLPQSQRIDSVTDATTIEMQMEATVSGTSVDITVVRDTFAMPDDMDNMLTKTWWDRTNHWMTIGPDSPQTMQWLKSGIVATGPRRHWSQIGRAPTAYRIWPPPTSEDTPAALAFEYISNGWIVASNDTTYKSAFTADTDTPLFNPQILILGLKWRFFQIKGMAYAPLQAEYNDFVAREKARDGGMPDLKLSNSRWPMLITSGNVQDGMFPGSG